MNPNIDCSTHTPPLHSLLLWEIITNVGEPDQKPYNNLSALPVVPHQLAVPD
jgi:hypothetical protein